MSKDLDEGLSAVGTRIGDVYAPPPAHLHEAALKALGLCEAECARTIAEDPMFRQGSGPLPPCRIALLACADACKVTALAIRADDPTVDSLGAWCAELCRTTVDVAVDAGWGAVAITAAQCEAACRSIASVDQGRRDASALRSPAPGGAATRH